MVLLMMMTTKMLKVFSLIRISDRIENNYLEGEVFFSCTKGIKMKLVYR